MSALCRRVDLASQSTTLFFQQHSILLSLYFYYATSVFGSFLDEGLGKCLCWVLLSWSLLGECGDTAGSSDFRDSLVDNSTEGSFHLTLGDSLTLG